MHKLTGRDIEKRAVMETLYFIENIIDNIILQSSVELEKYNKSLQTQCLPKKSRINQYCVKRAIKSLNSNLFSSSLNCGGELKDKLEDKLHLPEEKNSQR